MINWQKLVEDKERFFWTLHIGGWFGFAFVYYIGSLFQEMRTIYAFIIILDAYAGMLLTLPLRYVYRKIWNVAPWKMVAIVLVSSFVVGVVWTVFKNVNFWEIYSHGYRPDSLLYYFRYSTASFYIVLSWSGLYYGIKYYQMLQKEKENVLRSTTMAHQAQLKMLRYQLNPHFLFNTLNAISTLILIKENDSANAMVSRLSDFLRYSLDKDPIKKVKLEHEIEALKLYLDIEKIRFEDRLQVVIDIDEESEQALVPSLILQPLIENAIKYAIAVKEEGGIITIKVRTFAKDLLIEVADNGPGADITDGQLSRENGVGLPNTRERLQSLYGSEFSFFVSNNEPCGLKISIRLPYENSQDD